MAVFCSYLDFCIFVGSWSYIMGKWQIRAKQGLVVVYMGHDIWYAETGYNMTMKNHKKGLAMYKQV